MVDEDRPQGLRRGVIKDGPVGPACSILAGADEARLVPVYLQAIDPLGEKKESLRRFSRTVIRIFLNPHKLRRLK
ncbi:MAG: hypothetical protein HY717_13675 [Planctomycetes bacterium]|nr:hypothetical protein [Planctomycetota bacterium]